MKDEWSHTARHTMCDAHLHQDIYRELTNKRQRWVDIARLVQEVVLQPRSSQLIAALQNNFWPSPNTRHPSEQAVRIGQLQVVEAWMPVTHNRNYSTVTCRVEGGVGYLKVNRTTFNCTVNMQWRHAARRYVKTGWGRKHNNRKFNVICCIRKGRFVVLLTWGWVREEGGSGRERGSREGYGREGKGGN
jgi:hypothetical protein